MTNNYKFHLLRQNVLLTTKQSNIYKRCTHRPTPTNSIFKSHSLSAYRDSKYSCYTRHNACFTISIKPLVHERKFHFCCKKKMFKNEFNMLRTLINRFIDIL